MSRQTGNDPHLTGLLRVFKDYYPEVIVGEAVRGKASSFKASCLISLEGDFRLTQHPSILTLSGEQD